MEYYKKEVAVKDAVDYAKIDGKIWCVIELKYGKFDVVKLNHIHKSEKIIFKTD